MTQPYKKKLIEVAIPLEAINAASAREKSIRHGHPSTLHLWWARRPLAACRAVLFAQLVDDPSSHPDQFPTHEDQERERQRLFAIIEDLVKWENSTNEEVLERARAEIRRSCGGVLPPVYDPFSGGGSIPLEAQRLGLPAYGSDLNPVAVMIGKAMIEIPPKFKDMPPIHPGIKERSFYRNAEGLAEDVKFYGEWMREKALQRLAHLYPDVDLPAEYGGGKATVAAWIWARTVPSPDPAFGDVRVPIASTFMLSSRTGKEVWIEPIVDRVNKSIRYSIRKGGTKAEIATANEGTKAGRGSNFRCLISDTAITSEYVKTQGKAGQIGQTLIAIVAEGHTARVYVPPTAEHEALALSVRSSWEPETSLPDDPRNFWTVDYGLTTFGDLFTDRQLNALNTFCELANEVRAIAEQDALSAGMMVGAAGLNEAGTGAKAYAEAIAMYLAFSISKVADRGSSICTWFTARDSTRNTFARQSVPMTWDFAEMNVLLDGTGTLSGAVQWTSNSLSGLHPASLGEVVQMDAREAGARMAGKVISTDPPYYDNIGYADLSDFFYVWLRRTLKNVFPDLLGILSTPKADELVATPYRHGSKQKAENYFLEGMRTAIKAMADNSDLGMPATIYYAFKQSEIKQEGISSTGWATFLQAVVEAGFSVVGTWPVRTELSNRMIASGTNALANSVVLVCRKKEASAEVITRAEFIRALKRELPPAIAELQAANIAPADMPQSAIGPGMGVFSRYKAVLESDDSPMTVKAALQLINRELDEYLGGIQGEFDADTRFAITWFEQNGLKAGDYGTANNIATARGISVESVKHAGIVESAAGKVRILKRDEMDAEWEPDADTHLTIWECCQHLVRLHEKYGIGYEAAVMLKKYGAKAGDVRDLAYVLYSICEKRGDAKEATAYNALIADWTDLTREAATAPLSNKSGQMRFEV
ncbi:MAG: adenine-specific DNA methylase [Rhodobacteraceae bacterium HLUCCA08]|nr:MAG: adenine-specific DNA methylase [Rhodobacteraceae bacterium HLUCCA08]